MTSPTPPAPPNDFPLVLFIGGTGMLLPAVQMLLARGERVLTVARHPERAGSDPLLRSIQGNWAAAASMATAIRKEIPRETLIGKAIFWVHEPYATEVHRALSSLLAEDATVVHVVGSSRGNPTKDPVPDVYAQPRTYRRVILGFQGQKGQTRWLTDDEISTGTIGALDHKGEEKEFIVGRIEPWEDHP